MERSVWRIISRTALAPTLYHLFGGYFHLARRRYAHAAISQQQAGKDTIPPSQSRSVHTFRNGETSSSTAKRPRLNPKTIKKRFSTSIANRVAHRGKARRTERAKEQTLLGKDEVNVVNLSEKFGYKSGGR